MTNDAALPDVDVQFELPDDFHPMSIGIGRDAARAEFLARAGERAGEIPDAAVERFAQDYAAASQWLARAGVFYAASSLGAADGELTLGTLTLARVPLDCRDVDVAVDGLVEILGADDTTGADARGREARRLELPCGPAAVAVGAAVEMVLPAAEAGTAEDFPVPVASLEAWVPVPAAADPTRRSAIVLRFGTPSVRHWEAYCPVLVDALRSLRFPAAEGDSPPRTEPAPAPGASRIAAALG